MVLTEVVVAGLKVAVTPDGGLGTDNATLPENPLDGAIDTVTDPVSPRCKTTAFGEE